MPCPTLKELRAILAPHRKPYRPSTMWTRAESLTNRRDSSIYTELQERRNHLSIKKEAILPVSLFYRDYRTYAQYKAKRRSVASFVRMSQALYETTCSMFSSDEISDFFDEVYTILELQRIHLGRVREKDIRLTRFVDCMQQLQNFWHLNSQNGGKVLDKRNKEVTDLRRAMISSYLFMKCKADRA